MIDHLVLGAGIAGLGAAYGVRQSGEAAVIFEARNSAGGLLDNFIVNDFRFDTGVHLSFATESMVREIFDKVPYIEHDAESINWDNGIWLRHPAQNNMYPLPPEQKVELISGLISGADTKIENYRDWLINQYGLPIAERWPLVYTEKYWTLPGEQLGTQWIGKRMRKADVREVLRGALSDKVENTYYISKMRYPVTGGYRAFIQQLIDDADIQYGCRAKLVDQKTKSVKFENGMIVDYKNIISTIPLPDLVEIMVDVPDEIEAAARTLFATSMDLVSVGFRRNNVPPSLWFYIYDTDIWASRAYSPSRKAPSNAPVGCSSLQFEIYSSIHKPLNASPEKLKENTIYALKKMKLATEDDILFIDHRRISHANVVFDLGMEERRNIVRNWVESSGVTLAGRFGEWDYLWSNQAFLSGLKAGQKALQARTT